MKAAAVDLASLAPDVEAIVRDVIAMRVPLHEVDWIVGLTDEDVSDLTYETWHEYEPEHVPAPSVLVECGRLVDVWTLIRLVNRLHFEGQLRAYAKGDRFLELVKYFAAEGVAR